MRGGGGDREYVDGVGDLLSFCPQGGAGSVDSGGDEVRGVQSEKEAIRSLQRWLCNAGARLPPANQDIHRSLNCVSYRSLQQR